MKYLILILAVSLTACGGGGGTMTQPQANSFQEVLGKPLPDQSNVAPTDPFAPVLKKNGG
jgi:hypothetical protein